MRATLTIVTFLFASTAVASEFDGAWALSGKWTGSMGLALEVRGDRYKYWFSSDAAAVTYEVTDEKRRVISSHTDKPPRYPLSGRAIVVGETLELRGAGRYYDRKWRRIIYRGVPCLLAEQHYREWRQSGELPEDRLLFRLPRFDEKHPQLNYGGFEHSNGSISPTSPLPPKRR